MTRRYGISRRRFVQIGGGLVVVGLAGGSASADGDEGYDGHGEHDEHDDEVANVRVVYLSPDAPSVDVFVDGERVLRAVCFGTVSEYLELEPGEYDMAVAPAGEGVDAAVLDVELDVPAADLTVAAIGEVADENRPLELAVLEDDDSDPGDDTARVRVVHASPDSPAVDVVVDGTGDALFEDVAFGESGYAEVPEGSYELGIYPAGEREEAVLEVTVEADDNTVYSAFATGYVAPEDAPADEPLDVVLTVDSEAEDH
jgi:hypothetical protein